MTAFARGLADAPSQFLALAWAETCLSVVVAVVVWVTCRGLGRRWPIFQQALWLLVMLRLVLPPGLAQPLGAGALLGRLGLGFGQLPGPAGDAGGWGGTDTGFPGSPPDGAAPPALVPVGASLVLVLWAVTVAALVARDAGRARACKRLLSRASAVDGGVARLADRWRRRLGIRRSVRVVTADAQMSPFTVGLRHPLVFVPTTLLARTNRHALAAALAHELAHVARYDVLWLRLERWLGRLYFFNPAFWLASRRLHAGRESICDALAVSRGLVSGPVYVKGLLGMLQLNLQGVEAPSLTLSQRRILMRLESVLAVRPARRSRPVNATLAAAFVGCFLLPLAGADVPTTAAGAEEQSAQASPFVNPLPSARVSRSYGKGDGPLGPEDVFHRGVDLAAERGTPIVAPADGVVLVATRSYEPAKPAGTVIILDHQDGRRTFYAHLGELLVKQGQRVSRGETIARVGTSGRSTGPHLHFELWEGGRHVDPATAVSGWARVR